MHTIDLLDECLVASRQLGYHIRQEWLGGIGGGACTFGGRRWIFLDLGLNTAEQLEQLATALRGDPQMNDMQLSPTLRRVLGLPSQQSPSAANDDQTSSKLPRAA